MRRLSSIVPTVALLASIGLFALCLGNDGYYLQGSDSHAWSPSWGLLLLGWIGLLSGTVAWLGNPALVASWVFLLRKRHGVAAGMAVLALALMASFLLQDTVISSTAPTYSRIAGYGAGYWLWIASAGASLLGGITGAWPTDSPSPEDPLKT